jgi:hypothetical protein
MRVVGTTDLKPQARSHLSVHGECGTGSGHKTSRDVHVRRQFDVNTSFSFGKLGYASLS